MSWDRPGYEPVDFSTLQGLTLVNAERVEVDDCDELHFVSSQGRTFRLLHEQSCCERVSIESIVGDLADLIGSPITLAEETTQEGPKDAEWGDTSTWTFYKLATIKGYVDVRWLGESNGYYSESVSFLADGHEEY